MGDLTIRVVIKAEITTIKVMMMKTGEEVVEITTRFLNKNLIALSKKVRIHITTHITIIIIDKEINIIIIIIMIEIIIIITIDITIIYLSIKNLFPNQLSLFLTMRMTHGLLLRKTKRVPYQI